MSDGRTTSLGTKTCCCLSSSGSGVDLSELVEGFEGRTNSDGLVEGVGRRMDFSSSWKKRGKEKGKDVRFGAEEGEGEEKKERDETNRELASQD